MAMKKPALALVPVAAVMCVMSHGARAAPLVCGTFTASPSKKCEVTVSLDTASPCKLKVDYDTLEVHRKTGTLAITIKWTLDNGSLPAADYKFAPLTPFALKPGSADNGVLHSPTHAKRTYTLKDDVDKVTYNYALNVIGPDGNCTIDPSIANQGLEPILTLPARK
jgi:hypothetical protein